MLTTKLIQRRSKTYFQGKYCESVSIFCYYLKTKEAIIAEITVIFSKDFYRVNVLFS